MKKVLFFLLFLPIFGSAQHYVITTSGDTLTGKVRRGNIMGKRLTLKNTDGKQKIHLKDIREWNNGGMPVIVIPETIRKRTILTELHLKVDGKKKLFDDLYYDSYVFYTEDNGRYIQLTRHNIENYLKPELFKCPAFAEQYKNRKIRESNLFEVFLYYNQHCGG